MITKNYLKAPIQKILDDEKEEGPKYLKVLDFLADVCRHTTESKMTHLKITHRLDDAINRILIAWTGNIHKEGTSKLDEWTKMRKIINSSLVLRSYWNTRTGDEAKGSSISKNVTKWMMAEAIVQAYKSENTEEDLVEDIKRYINTNFDDTLNNKVLFNQENHKIIQLIREGAAKIDTNKIDHNKGITSSFNRRLSAAAEKTISKCTPSKRSRYCKDPSCLYMAIHNQEVHQYKLTKTDSNSTGISDVLLCCTFANGGSCNPQRYICMGSHQWIITTQLDTGKMCKCTLFGLRCTRNHKYIHDIKECEAFKANGTCRNGAKCMYLHMIQFKEILERELQNLPIYSVM